MVLLITGGSRGIGKNTVLLALARGYDVAFTYAKGVQEAEQVLSESQIRAPLQCCKAYPLDVRDPEAVEGVVNQINDDFETLEAVVCNAGITRNNLTFSMSNEEWQEVIDINLTGTFYVVRQCIAPFLANGKGHFVLISSIAKEGMSGQANYSASKAGLIGLSGTIAKEYGTKGITSNVVVPGFFDTDMTRSHMSESLKTFWNQQCPLKRMGTLQELSEVILFLASEKASFVNGQVISVTGGLDWAP